MREWKRRDWGEGGADFHWWCTDSHEAFGGAVPVYEGLADELRQLVGETPYELLVAHLAKRAPKARAKGEVFLPHPAARRRG